MCQPAPSSGREELIYIWTQALLYGLLDGSLFARLLCEGLTASNTVMDKLESSRIGYAEAKTILAYPMFQKRGARLLT